MAIYSPYTDRSFRDPRSAEYRRTYENMKEMFHEGADLEEGTHTLPVINDPTKDGPGIRKAIPATVPPGRRAEEYKKANHDHLGVHTINIEDIDAHSEAGQTRTIAQAHFLGPKHGMHGKTGAAIQYMLNERILELEEEVREYDSDVREFASLKEQISGMKADLAVLERTRANAHSKVASLEDDKVALVAEGKRLSADIEKLGASDGDHEEELQALFESQRALYTKVGEKQDEIDDAHRAASSADDNFHRVDADLSTLRTRYNEIDTKFWESVILNRRAPRVTGCKVELKELKRMRDFVLAKAREQERNPRVQLVANRSYRAHHKGDLPEGTGVLSRGIDVWTHTCTNYAATKTAEVHEEQARVREEEMLAAIEAEEQALEAARLAALERAREAARVPSDEDSAYATGTASVEGGRQPQGAFATGFGQDDISLSEDLGFEDISRTQSPFESIKGTLDLASSPGNMLVMSGTDTFFSVKIDQKRRADTVFIQLDDLSGAGVYVSKKDSAKVIKILRNVLFENARKASESKLKPEVSRHFIATHDTPRQTYDRAFTSKPGIDLGAKKYHPKADWFDRTF
ncbi:MAG: hypothetical protein S4CHLAM37_13470 [Chlamydiia bacterium]|nr:hypothetical protein [Chlamydiia bacterium]